VRRSIVALATLLALLTVPVLVRDDSGVHLCHARVAQAADQLVFFNTHSRIYHHAGCGAANRCTVNCIWIPLSEALERGGRACKLCGG
jgi:hypothetical protein